MPIDDLVGSITLPTRDKERDRWLRDYSFHKPDDDTSPGGEPYILASTVADLVMPLYAILAKIARAQDPKQITGHQLEVEAEPIIGPRLGAEGASGAIEIGASSTGTQIFRGDEFVINQIRYVVTQTKIYYDGQNVPVVGFDTGPSTNQRAGTKGTWSNPRPGCTSIGSVAEQQNGSGLTGGHDVESDDEYRLRWLAELADPPGGGNDAQVRKLAEDSNGTGVAVQKAFSYPAMYGPGSSVVTVTMSPESLGGSRVPTTSQLAQVNAYIAGSLPPDSYFTSTIVGHDVDVTYKVEWSDNAPGWADVIPWPSYVDAADPVAQAIQVSSVTSATEFTLESANASYTNLTAPTAGKRIAFFDLDNENGPTFVLKTILSVSGSGPWDITCDSTNQASDLVYVPAVGQRVSPWSDSLQSRENNTSTFVAAVLGYFARLGPGEQVSSFFDVGWRQRRQPTATPKSWPNVLTVADLTQAAHVDTVNDVEPLEPTLPYATPVGSPATYSYLCQLRYLCVLPQ